MSKVIGSITLVLALLGLNACGDPGRAPHAESSAPLPRTSEPVPQREASVSLVEPPAMEVAASPEPTVEEVGAGLSAPSPELYAVDGVRLRRLVLGRGISNREPVETGARFPNEERPLYAFVDLENTTEVDREVVVVFEKPDGTTVGHVSLTVPAGTPRWRTWAFSRMITQPGSWTANVLTEDGELLGRHDFEVVEES
jgi:hypothetical protein